MFCLDWRLLIAVVTLTSAGRCARVGESLFQFSADLFGVLLTDFLTAVFFIAGFVEEEEKTEKKVTRTLALFIYLMYANESRRCRDYAIPALMPTLM